MILTAATSADAVQVNATAALCAARTSFVSFGGVESNLNAKGAGALALPALSRQRPLTVADESSGLSYVGASQESMPDVASAPLYVTVRPWLYQPFESG